jgi:hypothetical protein
MYKFDRKPKRSSSIALVAAITAAAVLAQPSVGHGAQSPGPTAERAVVSPALDVLNSELNSSNLTSDAVSGPIATEEEAVDRARLLPFLPEHAILGNVHSRMSPTVPTWNVNFNSGNRLSTYSITLSQEDGNVMALSITDWAVERTEPAAQKEPISFTEAAAVAQNFIHNQSWGVDSQWIIDPYPESAYSQRYEDKTLHKIRFNRSVNGIRFVDNRFTVSVNQSGQVTAYQMNWSGMDFDDPSHAIGEKTAKDIYFDQTIPALYEQITNGNSRLVYSLWQNSMDAISGTFPPERNHNPYAGEAGPLEMEPPTVSADSAKRMLLALYDVELQYRYSSTSKVGLYYNLLLNPDVPRFYTGTPPVLEAYGEGWLNFIGQTLHDVVAPAGNWVDELLSSPERIEYAAAVVLDDRLLQLDSSPVIQDGSTLVPFRSLLEELGAEVQWIPEGGKIITSNGAMKIELALNSYTAIINGSPVKLDVPAQLLDESTFVPVRVVAEALDGYVDWEADSRLVMIRLQTASQKPSEDQLRQWRLEAQTDWNKKNAR